jgi:hypothetical protein
MSSYQSQEGAENSSVTGNPEKKAEQSTKPLSEIMAELGIVPLDESETFGGLAIIGAPRRSSSSESKKD